MKRLPLFLLCIIPLVGCSAGQTSNSEDSLIESESEAVVEKDETILVYSRGEERCDQAAQILVDLGYKDVYSFGSIMNWPYEVVLEEENN